MSGTRSVTFDVRRVRGKIRALSHKRPNRSCAWESASSPTGESFWPCVHATFLVYTTRKCTHTAGLADVFCTELRTGRFGGSSEIQSLAPASRTIFRPFFAFFSFFLSLHLAKRLCKTRSRAVDITKAAAVEYIIYIYKVIPAFRLSVRGEKTACIACALQCSIELQ